MTPETADRHDPMTEIRDWFASIAHSFDHVRTPSRRIERPESAAKIERFRDYVG